jgi:hypothetical protein
MPLHTWRRQHGPDLVAQVTPVEGLGTWDASAWPVSAPADVARSPRKIADLVSAQATADHLVRRTFDHTCDLHTCGDWTFWPQ